jgi:hypothetical protein
MAQRYKSISTLLKDNQSHSLLAGENRTSILKVTIAGETLSGLDLNCADFVNCEVSDSTFYKCDLRGASFRESSVERVKFVDCSICDMELPENFSSIAFHNCSTLPSGMGNVSKTGKEPPTTIYGKIVSVIEEMMKAMSFLTSLSTEKILSMAILLAFIAIIVVAISLPK